MSNFYVGIDGGGSNLRVAIVDDALSVLAEAHRETANPSVIGHDESANRVQSALREALQSAQLSPDDIRGVGVGIAGASAEHSALWLREMVTPIFPASHLALSSDVEIALVGAQGQRYGILLLAGTGSCAYGVNVKGQGLLIGGWGYLIGDEGGGFSIGLHALKYIVQETDAGRHDLFIQALLDTLNVQQPRHLVRWLYGHNGSPVRDVARIAQMVIQHATDPAAYAILVKQASYLTQLVHQVTERLEFSRDVPVKFAGGLLEQANPYSDIVVQQLHLTDYPNALYSPVIGGALLAKLELET